jgi:hypothetical protein
MAGSTSEIRKGMPGLKQAGKIANDRLTKHLAKFGYTPVPHSASGNTTPGTLFRPSSMTLESVHQLDDAHHLLHALK